MAVLALLGSSTGGMGVYGDDGRGSAFCTSMKLFHTGLEQWCPAEVSTSIGVLAFCFGFVSFNQY